MFNLAQACNKRGMIEKEIEWWNKFLEINPTNVRALNSIGNAYK